MTANTNIRPQDMPPDIRAKFQALNRIPAIAWPTMTIAVVYLTADVVLWYLGFSQTVAPWICGVLAGVLGNWSFTVIHDGIHRSISSNQKLNDLIARLVIGITIPWATLELLRWGHARHHRFTGGAQDPDRWSQGTWWQLPLRWALIDVGYIIEVILTRDPVAMKHMRRTLVHLGVTIAAAAILTWQGYGEQVFWLFLVPSRIALVGLGFTFFWLPHVPHDTSQAENFTRASTVRVGHERFMNIALQYQNFHLLHHMYPTTPHYNNTRLWHLLEPLLRQRELAIQHGFAIRPEIWKPAPRHETPEAESR